MSVLWQQQTHGVPKREEQANRKVARLFLLTVLVIALLAAAYLGLVAWNVRLARQVWTMENQLMTLERQNQALITEIARLSSIPVLQDRSVKRGYQPAKTVDFIRMGEQHAP